MAIEAITAASPSLEELSARIMELGQMAETSISRASVALLQRDTMLARAVIKEDEEIDRAEVEIEEFCLQVLEHERLQGPELRHVVAVLKINDSLERIGDLAENIAEVVVEVGDWERFQRVAGIRELAEYSQGMVRRSLESLQNRDTYLARTVIKDDDFVDELYNKIKQRIEDELERIPENANPLLKLENVVRQFERVGDIATNIAEEVIHLVEGTIVRHVSPRSIL